MSIEAEVHVGLTDAYTVQVRSDIERIDSEIAQMQARLKALSADRVVLGKLWESLNDGSEPAPKANDGRTGRSRRRAGAAMKADAGKPSSEGSKTADAMNVRQTVFELLKSAEGAMSVNDMSAALEKAHPTRHVSKVVIRNTMELLVAKSIAQRSRQGNFVFYTIVDGASDYETG